MTLASIVIRCYNEEEHIGRLLSGIMQQTLRDVEIILVDRGQLMLRSRSHHATQCEFCRSGRSSFPSGVRSTWGAVPPAASSLSLPAPTSIRYTKTGWSNCWRHLSIRTWRWSTDGSVEMSRQNTPSSRSSCAGFPRNRVHGRSIPSATMPMPLMPFNLTDTLQQQQESNA